jgi:hypothetical protein
MNLELEVERMTRLEPERPEAGGRGCNREGHACVIR